MRILMLACNSGLQDGINRHILAIAPEINKIRGCHVAVCTTYSSGELNVALEASGVKVYALGLPHGHDLRTWWRFGKVMREFKPDVIHAHVMGLLERWYIGLFRKDIPVVATCHGITDAESGVAKVTWKDKVESLIGRFTPGHISKTIFISRGVAIAKGCPDATVAYNPVVFVEANAVKDVNILRTELGLSADVPIIGTACRVSPPKKPHAFVDVMCRVLQVVPAAHAVVCGTAQDDSLMSELKRLVYESGVEDRFHWLGYRKDAPQITREVNCFVMTSATEGMPTALLEAMAVKTPIAFMRGKGGLVDLDEMNRKEGPIGVVADADDCDGLSRQIVELLTHPDQARDNAERAFEFGKRHFDIGLISQRIVKIYNEVIRG